MSEQIPQEENRKTPETKESFREKVQRLRELHQKFNQVVEEGKQTGDFSKAYELKLKIEELLQDIERSRPAHFEFDEDGFLKSASVRVGTHSNIHSLINEVSAPDCLFTNSAFDMLSSKESEVEGQERSIRLEVITPQELGLGHAVTTQQVMEAAQKAGYKPVPLETVLQLRRQYTDQNIDESLVVGHTPIKSTAPRRSLLGLGCAVSSSLKYDTKKTVEKFDGESWRKDARFVFEKSEE